MSDDSTGSPTHRYPSNGVQGHYSGCTSRQMNSGPEYQLGGSTLENGHISNGIAVGGNDSPPKERGLCGGGKSSKEVPQRYVLVFMSFLAFVNIYMMYLNLSVTLPAMVDHNATKLKTLDDKKGVFFENSELESEAYEQINNNFSTKREKRQRNVSQDDLYYLNTNNDIESSSHPINSSASPLVSNMIAVTSLPISDSTLVLDVAKIVSQLPFNATSSMAQKHSTDDLGPNNNNSTLELVENTLNLTSFELTTSEDPFVTSTLKSIANDTLTSGLQVDSHKNASSNTSDVSEASITLNIITKPTEGNHSLNQTEGEHNLVAKESQNINLSIDGRSKINIAFNKDKLNSDHLELESVYVHLSDEKEHEALNHTILDVNNTVKRIKRSAAINPISLPSFHVAQIVPVAKVPVTEKPNVHAVTMINNVTPPQSLTNFSNGETFINTLEASELISANGKSKNSLNQTPNENRFTLATTDHPVTNATSIDPVTIPTVSFSSLNVELNESSTTKERTKSQIDGTSSSTMAEEIQETTESGVTIKSMPLNSQLQTSGKNSSNHSLNETFSNNSEREVLVESFSKSDESEIVATTSSISEKPEIFSIDQLAESSPNGTLSMEDATSFYSFNDEFGLINLTETSTDNSLISDVVYTHTTTNTPSTDFIVQSTETSNNTSENSTQNIFYEILINNVTSLSVEKLNTILTSNFKDNLIKDTTAPSNEGVQNAENFLVERPANMDENNNSKTPVPNTQLSNDTSFMNTALPFVIPLSIPCQTFLFVNCSITGNYHVIDKKGMDTANSNESDWVTLKPIPQLSGNYSFHRDDDDDDDNNKIERQKLIKKYNFTEHFNLVDCQVSHGDDEENSDIKCITSHGPIKLNIIDENDTSASSSSSSSSSSQENDEEEEESEEGEEEEEEEEEEGEEEDEEEETDKNGKNKEGKEKGKGGFVDFGRWVPPGNYRKITLRDKKEDSEKSRNEGQENNEENEEENNEENEEEKEENGELEEDNEKANEEDEASSKVKDDQLKNKECEESSEECGEEEEGEEEEEEEEEGEEEKEGDGEEEHDENELTEEFAGPASGQIKLDEKIPSTVCFYKKFADSDSFHGYEDGEFNWEPELQTRIISAYYWGFLISQIPAGRLSAIVGGKLLLLFGVLMAGIITLFTPLLASAGAYWLLTARVILGMMQGICMPATQALLAKWAPPMERTRMVAYTYSGIAVGAAMGGPLSAYLIQEIGWRTLCYGQGAIALIWSALWFLLIAESPCTHPRITSREREFVVGAIGYQHAGVGIPVPWCSILRSRHVLALMLAQGSYLWAWHTLLHYAPKYIATVLHDDLPVVQSVWGASLACMFVMTCAYGTLADWLRKSRKLSTISVRRAANSICSILSAAFLVGVSQSYCNREAVKVCFALAIAMGFPGAFSGIFANSLDISPNHAAAITGICGAFATTASILAPYYWSLIVSGRQTLERWRTIWYTCAIFLLLANCLYFLLVGTKEQRWNRPVTLNKTPKRDDDHEVVMPRRRANQTHGMKPKLYASTEHL